MLFITAVALWLKLTIMIHPHRNKMSNPSCDLSNYIYYNYAFVVCIMIKRNKQMNKVKGSYRGADFCLWFYYFYCSYPGYLQTDSYSRLIKHWMEELQFIMRSTRSLPWLDLLLCNLLGVNDMKYNKKCCNIVTYLLSSHPLPVHSQFFLTHD